MSDVAAENFDAFLESYDLSGHEEYIELADKCDKFYVSDQWDEDTVAKLGDRPALTINESARSINAILGHYATSRADLVFKPRKSATEEQAKILTQLVDQILDQNLFPYVEGMVFADGVIADRGYFDVRMDFEGNLLGEVKITSEDPRTILLDPYATDYDPATWNQVIKYGWWTLEDIELLYGKDKAEQVRAVADAGEAFGSRSIRFGGDRIDAFPSAGYEGDRRRVRAVNVIERQYCKIGTVYEFVDLETGDLSRVPEGMSLERAQQLAQAAGLGLRKRLAKRIRWTVSADHVLLFDDWSPYDEFTIVPFFPYFRRGKPAGVMRSLLGPQEMLNKIESQELHIVNTTANSGWQVEAGSLVNMTEQELEERGADTGLVLVYGRGRTPPTKIEPNQVPPGITNIAAKARSYLTEIPGVSSLVSQVPKSDVSGVTLSQGRSIALAGLQPVFDNLQYTRMLLGRRVLKLIQRFYTEPRVLRVTDWRAPEQASQPLSINTDILNNVTLGEYDLVVSSAPVRDTFEESQFAQALEMRREGVAIPDHYVILSSHLAQKKEIAELVKRLQGLTEPDEQTQQVQQMQQELLIKQAVGQLQELEAKVQKLRAEAGLAEAKAQSAVLEAQINAAEAQAAAEFNREKLIADLHKQAANLMNKLELAERHIAAKTGLTKYTTASKNVQDMLKARTEERRNAAQVNPQHRVGG